MDQSFVEKKISFFEQWLIRHERELAFKRKVVELLKRHNIGTSEEIAFLEGFVQGS